MRKIKFRVWCNDHQEWERDYCFLSQDGLIFQLNKITGRLLCIRPEKHVVEFFTGFFDKNGTAIYEGDIILLKKEESTFDEDKTIEMQLPVKYFPNYGFKAVWGHQDCNKEYIGKCEIIGNIHENPELLKQ